ncbi:UNVERIFIED_CONTAM: hypothetical protein GTU68_057527 [Idotea baltica]|nr:hypothetical protein [Idotea baltica]
MNRYLALTSILVNDYDEAINFYVNKLDFDLREDTATVTSAAPDAPKRWVVVAPSKQSQCALLLAQASDDAQRARVGDQTGGRVFLFLNTDDFWRDYEMYKSRGVEFVRGEPREEAYGTVAVFKDVSGNLWDLIERKQ